MTTKVRKAIRDMTEEEKAEYRAERREKLRKAREEEERIKNLIKNGKQFYDMMLDLESRPNIENVYWSWRKEYLHLEGGTNEDYKDSRGILEFLEKIVTASPKALRFNWVWYNSKLSTYIDKRDIFTEYYGMDPYFVENAVRRYRETRENPVDSSLRDKLVDMVNDALNNGQMVDDALSHLEKMASDFGFILIEGYDNNNRMMTLIPKEENKNDGE